MVNIRRAVQLIWQAAPGWTVARASLLVMQGLLPLALLYLTKRIVDIAALGLADASQAEVWAKMLPLLLGLGAVMLLTNFCDTIASLVGAAQTERVTDHMQGILYAKSMEVDLECYENSQHHDQLERAREEAPYRPGEILLNLSLVGQATVTLAAISMLLFSLHWGIAGVLVVVAAPAMLVRLKYSKAMYHWEREHTALERQAWYRGWLLSADRPAKELRIFNLGQYFLEQFHQIRKTIYREKFKISLQWSFHTMAAQGIASLAIFAVFSYIVYKTIDGALLIGDLILYYQALKRGQDSLQGLMSGLSGLYEDNLFLTNLYEFLELQPRIIEPAMPRHAPRPMQAGIELRDVSFKYSTTERQALEKINLTLRPGEKIALVGENGSGKTTLVKLICRLYDPSEGQVMMDGIDFRDLSIVDLRRQISVIFQDYEKYHLTAHDNIHIGNIDLEADHELLSKAAFYSGADDIIQSLPKGYETVLGKWFEDGEELSIGQWQKIALARALSRKSQLIILDEPSSAMDPKAESELFEQFRNLVKDQAAILISHKLSSVKMVDRIYVMEQGRIVEEGSHTELLRLGGTYTRLFEMQAKNYR